MNGAVASSTKLTKSGQPKLGTVLDFRVDDTWETATVCAKQWTNGYDLVRIQVVWADGAAQWVDWDATLRDYAWRCTP